MQRYSGNTRNVLKQLKNEARHSYTRTVYGDGTWIQKASRNNQSPTAKENKPASDSI